MTPDRSHLDTVGRVANKVGFEGGEAPFHPYFYGPKYPSSDALPAPQIFNYTWAPKEWCENFDNRIKIITPPIDIFRRLVERKETRKIFSRIPRCIFNQKRTE